MKIPQIKKQDVPNLITIFRGAAGVAAIGFLLAPYGFKFKAALAIFSLAASSDWLDGFLARRWRVQSALGAFLDPLFDKIVVLGMFFVLSRFEVVPVWVLLILLVRDLAVDGLRSLAVKKEVELATLTSAKIKTVLQMLMICAALGFLAWPVLAPFKLLAWFFGFSAVGFSLQSAWVYLQKIQAAKVF